MDHMDHTNYRDCSLEQLYEALDSVDNLNYPDQRNLIEKRIEELEGKETKSDLEGIGGWLALVAIGLIVAPFRLAFSVIGIYSKAFSSGAWCAISSAESEYYNPLLVSILSAEIAINCALLGSSIFLIYLFFTKKPFFPKFYIGVTVFSLLFLLVDSWAITQALPGQPIFDSNTTKQFIVGVISALIWVPYMLISKRVKATFR